VTTAGGTNPSPTLITPTVTPPPTQFGDPPRATPVRDRSSRRASAAKSAGEIQLSEVIAPTSTHYSGNQGVYTSGQCLRGGTWDACNNVEGISIPLRQVPAPIPSSFTARRPKARKLSFALVASGNGLQPQQQQHPV